jgi:phosphoenolpyruvate synthase/pyruvate phosphate dikinase
MLVIWQWGYLPFLIDDAIGFELNDLLIKLGIEPKAITETIKILGTSSKFTLAKKQEFELLELAEKVKKGGLDKYKKQIEKHLAKWGWKNSWIYSQHDLTLGAFEGEILSFSRKNPKQILKDIKNEREKEIAQKRKILAKYKNKQLNALADVLAEYHHWHTFKMEELTRAIYLLKPTLFKKLGEKLGLSFEEIIELTPEEIEKEDINRETIKNRLKDNGIVMIDGEIKVLSHEEINQVKNILERTYSDTKILKGIIAFKGNVKGKAAVLPSGSIDISKIFIDAGRIVVTSMTTPNMVSLVRNAIGIITDEGGLLCHAAIISRELGLPCITGTKIATKIIKDGDLLELDGEKGEVRIIK